MYLQCVKILIYKNLPPQDKSWREDIHKQADRITSKSVYILYIPSGRGDPASKTGCTPLRIFILVFAKICSWKLMKMTKISLKFSRKSKIENYKWTRARWQNKLYDPPDNNTKWKEMLSTSQITRIKMWRIFLSNKMITFMLSSRKLITPNVYGNVIIQPINNINVIIQSFIF